MIYDEGSIEVDQRIEIIFDKQQATISDVLIWDRNSKLVKRAREIVTLPPPPQSIFPLLLCTVQRPERSMLEQH